MCVAFVAAAISCFFVPIDKSYVDYIDFRTLALLYCLMVVVAGLRSAGLFETMAHALCARVKSVRTMGAVLVFLCFFMSMLVTNDVALMTFVPFAVAVLGMANKSKELLWVVVLQTIAANLGSMLTPVGNPQNLYIYSHYGISIGDFFAITAPTWVLGGILTGVLLVLLPRDEIRAELGEKPSLDQKRMILYTLLFVVCLLVVIRVVSWPVMLAVIIVVLLVFERKKLVQADFCLLLTFVFFFVFAGNLARIESVARLLQVAISGREMLVAALTSQVISNVPAALLLSGFTDNAKALLLGVDIGGLGTPIASLASLISLKLFSETEGARIGAFLARFMIINIALLVVLLIVASVFF